MTTFRTVVKTYKQQNLRIDTHQHNDLLDKVKELWQRAANSKMSFLGTVIIM
jgi:hypothetical protein